MTNRERLLGEMKKITDTARQEGCLLEAVGGDRVFTPDGLDKANQTGRFIWAGWGNWTLIKPDRYLEQAWHKMLKAQNDYRDAQDLVEELRKELEGGGKEGKE